MLDVLSGKHFVRSRNGQPWTFCQDSISSSTDCGNFWQLLATFGKFWQIVATFGRLWQLLATLGTFWQLLTTFGRLWQLLVTFGRLWQLFATIGINICPQKGLKILILVLKI